MQHRTSALLVLLTAVCACEGTERTIAGPNGESIDMVATANAYCDTVQACCVPPNLPWDGWNHDDCVTTEYSDLLNAAEVGAALGRWADPECFERLSDCTLPGRECVRPCKLFFGARQLGESCDRDSDYDDCAQGLVCQEYGHHEWECDDPPLYRCSGDSTRCIDPCASQEDAACQVSDAPSSCGPDAFCHDMACRPLAPIGGSCDGASGAPCIAGTFCDGSALGGPTCTAPLAEGMPCTDNDMCSTGRCGKDPVDDEAVGLCEQPLWDGCTPRW
jgi:hypothetical protein